MLSLFVKAQTLLAGLHDRERGQDLVEYALFGGLIAIGIIAVGVAAYTGIINSLTGGIKNCVDFNSATSCAPF
jgi:Flp pilus assembly pilin Flp